MPDRAVVLQLKAIQAYDRLRLKRLTARHPGLEIHPSASSNLAAARYDLADGARLRIGAGVVTERLAHNTSLKRIAYWPGADWPSFNRKVMKPWVGS